MADDAAPEQLTPAERRLAEHLDVLRADPPQPGTALVKRVVRTARWQGLLRAPLRAVGMVAAGIAEGLGALLGVRRRSR